MESNFVGSRSMYPELRTTTHQTLMRSDLAPFGSALLPKLALGADETSLFPGQIAFDISETTLDCSDGHMAWTRR